MGGGEPTTPVAARHVAFDLPGLAVGVAEYEEGPTGCTVLLFDDFARVAIDIRGGMPAVFNATSPAIEALCLAGGSILGLEASTGVAAELFARRGRDPSKLPVVSGGCIYDYAAPGRTAIYADRELGRAALRAAVPHRIAVGAVGAGRSATCGKLGRQGWAEPGGQGAAFGRAGEVRVVVVVVVNALGVIVNRQGDVVRGNRDPDTGERSHLTAEAMVHGHERQRQRFGQRFAGATTLTVVVTDARLNGRDLSQLSRQVHTSLARAIHPFNASGDGDTLWLISTNTLNDPTITPTALGAFASELAWDAVLNSVDA